MIFKYFLNPGLVGPFQSRCDYRDLANLLSLPRLTLTHPPFVLTHPSPSLPHLTLPHPPFVLTHPSSSLPPSPVLPYLTLPLSSLTPPLPARSPDPLLALRSREDLQQVLVLSLHCCRQKQTGSNTTLLYIYLHRELLSHGHKSIRDFVENIISLYLHFVGLLFICVCRCCRIWDKHAD